MGLKEQQDLLARLYTDIDLQSKFLDSPLQYSDEFGLEPAEAEALARVADEEVRWFADSLHHKRLREVSKLLPLSKRIIGSEFDRQFSEFSKTFIPTSLKKHLEDAQAFSDSLLSSSLNSLAKNVVRFESVRLRHNAFDRRFSACLLRYDPHRMNADNSLSSVKRGIGIFVAVGRWSRIFFR